MGEGWERVGEGWERVGEGWERVGEGWERVGEGWDRVGGGWGRVGEGWQRVGEGWDRVGEGSERVVRARHVDAIRYVHTFILVKHLFVYDNEYLCVIGSVYHAEILCHISQTSNTIFVVAGALIVWRSIQLCGDYCVPFLCCFVFKQWRAQHSSNATFFCLHPVCSSSSAHKTPPPPSAREVHKRCFCQDKRKERKRAAVSVVMHRIS